MLSLIEAMYILLLFALICRISDVVVCNVTMLQGTPDSLFGAMIFSIFLFFPN